MSLTGDEYSKSAVDFVRPVPTPASTTHDAIVAGARSRLPTLVGLPRAARFELISHVGERPVGRADFLQDW